MENAIIKHDDGSVSYRCGCLHLSYGISFCKIHIYAMEMFNQLRALKRWMEAEDGSIVISKNSASYKEIECIISKVEE